jgi:hypothetical protein
LARRFAYVGDAPAEYAATDLPPGVDPWAALADSDDPATSALAAYIGLRRFVGRRGFEAAPESACRPGNSRKARERGPFC